MRKVLVTGATGFLGRNSLAALAAGEWEIHACHRNEPHPEVPGVAWHRADLLDPADTARLLAEVAPSHLLDLAWYFPPGRWAQGGHDENLRWVAATLELARAFRAAGGRRMVFAGSSTQYDWASGLCREGITPLEPATLHGACKLAAECALLRYAQASGFSAASGRVFFLFGPWEGRARFVPHVVRALLAGKVAECSHGMQIRDYLYAPDAADALVHLLASDLEGPCNVASGQPVRLREVAAAAAEIIGRPDLLRFGSVSAQGADDAPVVLADVGRLRSRLGWQPSCDLREGLRRTIDWWRAQPPEAG